MITKNILKYLAACLLGCGMVTAISSCSEDDPFFSAGENDAPRILNTDIPEGEGGEPGVIMDIQRTQNFEFEVIVTPARYTTVTWFIDDEQVAEGLKINVPVLAGDHILKIVATTTKGLTASRTCKQADKQKRRPFLHVGRRDCRKRQIRLRRCISDKENLHDGNART